jgi:hypothetical protein
LKKYVKAAGINKMILLPRFLLKLEKTAGKDALKYFTDIQDNYDRHRGCIS